MFEGSMAEKLVFLSFEASVLKEVSQKSFVLGLRSSMLFIYLSFFLSFLSLSLSIYLSLSLFLSRYLSISLSQLLKILKAVRTWCVLYMLTLSLSISLSLYLSVSTSKSGPNMVCFVHVDFEMDFTPQRRAILHFSSGQLAPRPPL